MALSGWDADKKIAITIDATDIDADLTDFPVLVNLGSASGKTDYDTSAVFDDLGANSKKIAFEIGNTGVQCYAEIESWDISLTTLYPDNGTSTMISASSILSASYPASYAFDGIADSANTSRWVSAAGVLNTTTGELTATYLDFDFGSAEEMAQVRFHNNGYDVTNFIKTFNILTSDTGAFAGEETDHGELTCNNATGGTWSDWITSATTASARYLRIQINEAYINDAADTYIAIGEIEFKIPKSASAQYHVKVPSALAASGGELNLWYDNTHADNDTYIGDTGDAPAQAVWDEDYDGVYHLSQDPSIGGACILDSTGNENHATPYGSMVADDLVDGLFGKAIDFGSSSKYIQFPFALPTVANMVEVFCSYNVAASLVGLCTSGNSPVDSAPYFLLQNNAGTLRTFALTGGYGTYDSIDTDTWYNITIARTSTTENFYLDYDGYVGTQRAIGTTGGNEEFYLGSGYNAYSDVIVREFRVSSIVRSDAWRKATNLSLTDALLTYSTAIDELLVVLSQTYDLEAELILAVLSQTYDILYSVTAELRQPYGDSFFAVLSQQYGDMPELLAVLKQFYGDKPALLAVLRQEYDDLVPLMAVLSQSYSLNDEHLAVLKQRYSSLEQLDVAVLRQMYDILERNELLSVLLQPFSMIASTTGDTLTTGVTANGEALEVFSIDYGYGIDSYCASFSFSIPYEKWLTIEDKAEIIATINGTAHYSMLVDKRDSQTVASSTYTIECRSPAVLLDFPWADRVPEDFEVTGTASQIVEALANLEGLSITWHMDSDPPLTDNDVQVAEQSPLAGIKSIVNELGGRINSYPDGSIHAVKRYDVNSNEYDLATPVLELSTLEDYSVLNTDVDKRYGYNKFSVSNVSTSSEYELESESITNSKYLIKAYRVPWISTAVDLITSESTNVTILPYVQPLTKQLTETIEIYKGEGKVSKPCYGLIATDYKDSTNLGLVTVDESGTVSTAVEGNTMVTLTYTTKYWQWEVRGTDSEQVQFILVTL